jgi:hypothetical protein
MLLEAGAVVAVGGVLTYGTIKVMDWVVDEVLQFVPVIGQIASGAISGAMSGTLGVLWWWACDSAYRRGISVPSALREATQLT